MESRDSASPRDFFALEEEEEVEEVEEVVEEVEEEEGDFLFFAASFARAFCLFSSIL